VTERAKCRLAASISPSARRIVFVCGSRRPGRLLVAKEATLMPMTSEPGKLTVMMQAGSWAS